MRTLCFTTYPLVEERHKTIAFRFPCRHVLHHAGIPADKIKKKNNKTRVYTQISIGKTNVDILYLNKQTHHLSYASSLYIDQSIIREYVRYPAKGPKGSFDVFCGDFRAEVADKDMKMICRKETTQVKRDMPPFQRSSVS